MMIIKKAGYQLYELEKFLKEIHKQIYHLPKRIIVASSREMFIKKYDNVILPETIMSMLIKNMAALAQDTIIIDIPNPEKKRETPGIRLLHRSGAEHLQNKGEVIWNDIMMFIDDIPKLEIPSQARNQVSEITRRRIFFEGAIYDTSIANQYTGTFIKQSATDAEVKIEEALAETPFRFVIITLDPYEKLVKPFDELWTNHGQSLLIAYENTDKPELEINTRQTSLDYELCESCKGSGIKYNRACKTCDGEGSVEVTKYKNGDDIDINAIIRQSSVKIKFPNDQSLFYQELVKQKIKVHTIISERHKKDPMDIQGRYIFKLKGNYLGNKDGEQFVINRIKWNPDVVKTRIEMLKVRQILPVKNIKSKDPMVRIVPYWGEAHDIEIILRYIPYKFSVQKIPYKIIQ